MTVVGSVGLRRLTPLLAPEHHHSGVVGLPPDRPQSLHHPPLIDLAERLEAPVLAAVVPLQLDDSTAELLAHNEERLAVPKPDVPVDP